MEFGKLRNARESMVETTLSLDLLSENILEKLRGKATENRLRFDVSFCGKTEIDTDEELLSIVVNNLIENAINYAAPNTVIRIKTSNVDRIITFEIQNEHSNMETIPETLDVFFDPFYRADKARNFVKKNIGIGLSFCKEVMIMLGGEITATKSSDHSLCFTIRLPAKEHVSD
jgi:signal transduction histidine kinase